MQSCSTTAAVLDNGTIAHTGIGIITASGITTTPMPKVTLGEIAALGVHHVINQVNHGHRHSAAQALAHGIVAYRHDKNVALRQALIEFSAAGIVKKTNITVACHSRQIGHHPPVAAAARHIIRDFMVISTCGA